MPDHTQEPDWVNLNWQDFGLGSTYGTGDEVSFDLDPDLDEASYNLWLYDEGNMSEYLVRMSTNTN